MIVVKSRPFSDILRLAQSGDRQAQNEILLQYMDLINRNCFIDGAFDEDCRQYIMLRIVKQLPRFKGEKKIL